MKKSLELLLAASLAVSLPCIATAAVKPFKEILAAEHRAGLAQPTVYALAEPRGLGLEYYDNTRGSLVSGLIATAFTANPVNLIATPAIDAAFSAKSITRLVQTANQIGTLTPGNIQQLLETQLAEGLATVPLFAEKSLVRKLDANRDLKKDPLPDAAALTIRLGYALTPDARAVHVVLNAEMLGHGARSPQTIYRNRLDYYSLQIPVPAEKTATEIEAKKAEVEAKYPPPVSKTELREKNKELKQAAAKRTDEERLEYYLSQWSANDAQRLQQEVHDGVVEVVRLLVRDVQDDSVVPQPTPKKATAKDFFSRQPARHDDGDVIETSGDRVVFRALEQDPGTLTSRPNGFDMVPANAVRYGDQKDPL